MKTIKILFAEDHNMVRDGIKLMLNNQDYFKTVIDEACDGVEAIEMASKKEYDLLLLDINLPGKDGIEVAELLISKNKQTKILALSMHEEVHVVKQMLDAGALGYILKNSGIEELTKAILTVNNGERYYSNEIAQILLNQNNKNQKKKDVLSNPAIGGLTRREIEVLKYIGMALSDKEIGEKLKISYRTVGNHRTNLLQKIQVNKTAGLVAFAIKNGIV